jgi:hypothetical protein
MFGAYTLIPYRRAYIPLLARIEVLTIEGAPHHRVFVRSRIAQCGLPALKRGENWTKSGSTTGFG